MQCVMVTSPLVSFSFRVTFLESFRHVWFHPADYNGFACSRSRIISIRWILVLRTQMQRDWYIFEPFLKQQTCPCLPPNQSKHHLSLLCCKIYIHRIVSCFSLLPIRLRKIMPPKSSSKLSEINSKFGEIAKVSSHRVNQMSNFQPNLHFTNSRHNNIIGTTRPSSQISSISHHNVDTGPFSIGQQILINNFNVIIESFIAEGNF